MEQQTQCTVGDTWHCESRRPNPPTSPLSSHFSNVCSLQPSAKLGACGAPRPHSSPDLWPRIDLLPAKQHGLATRSCTHTSPLLLPPLQAARQGIPSTSGRATAHSSRTSQPCRGRPPAFDQPITFNKKIISSGYGTTHGKASLGHPPPKPLKPRRSPVTTAAALLRAEPYPMNAPPPVRAQTRLQVFAAPVSAGCAVFSAGGVAVALGAANGKVVAIEASKLLTGCAAAQLKVYPQTPFGLHTVTLLCS